MSRGGQHADQPSTARCSWSPPATTARDEVGLARGRGRRALAVGQCVQTGRAESDFSSRGPRLGDGAVKPEIAAPGEAIVAARPAGVPPLGEPVGDALPAAERHVDGDAARRRLGGDPGAAAPGLDRRPAQGRR